METYLNPDTSVYIKQVMWGQPKTPKLLKTTDVQFYRLKLFLIWLIKLIIWFNLEKLKRIHCKQAFFENEKFHICLYPYQSFFDKVTCPQSVNLAKNSH